MSLTDREKLFEEVNGIPDLIDENSDPEFVNKRLDELDQQLGKVTLDKSAYHLAMALRPELRHDRKFRLMFLRSECFDTRKAARRMVNYYTSKRLLFGEENGIVSTGSKKF